MKLFSSLQAWICALSIAVAAQDFAGRFDGYLQKDNLAAIGQLVFREQSAAEQLFRQHLSALLADPAHQAHKRQANVLARALLLSGHPTCSQVLKDAGLLLLPSAWQGTAFEEDERQRLGPSSVATELAPSAASPEQNRCAAAQLAIRVGSLPAARQLLRACAPSTEVSLLEMLAQEAAGNDSQALQIAQRIASQPLNRQQQLLLHLASAEAAHHGALPRQREAEVQQLETLLATPGPADATTQMASFVTAALRLESRQELGQGAGFAELLATYQAAWRQLDGLQVSQLPTGGGRWLTRAAGVFQRRAWELARAESQDFPIKAQLEYLQSRQLERLEVLNQEAFEASFRVQPADPTQFLQLWNSEFYLGLFELRLQAQARLLAAGDRQALEAVQGPLKSSREAFFQRFKEANFAYQAAIFKLTGSTQQSPLLFSWFEGSVPRLLGQYHVQQARRLLLKGSPLDRASCYEIERELEEARQRQSETSNWSGLDDWRYTYLEYQVLHPEAPRPPDWLARSAQWAGQLVEEARAREFRPALVLALSYQARVTPNQAIGLLREAVQVAESWITETGAGVNGSVNLRQQFASSYRLLAEKLLHGGHPEESFELLGRLAQLNQVSDSAQRSDPALRSLRDFKLRSGQAGEDLPATHSVSDKAAFYATVGELRRKNPAYESLAVRPVNLARLQKFLPEDCLLVQYFPTDKNLYLFVADGKKLNVRQADVSSRQLMREVMKWRRQVLQRDCPDESGGRLYSWLIAPLEADMSDKKVVAVIPTQALFYLPFGALKGPHGYLVESKEVAVLSKSADLMNLAQKPEPMQPRLMALGNPDGSLPGATQEVQQLGEIIPDARILIGAEARKERLGDLQQANLLHLATHGVVNRSNPLKTYLVMAGSDPAAQRLTLQEISAGCYDGVRLATLSACETAVGENGSELQTVAETFSYAGVSSVVASLWSVSDDSTRDLMVEFYRQIKQGARPSAAMQAAQLRLLHQPATASPFFWSPFILMGEWR